MSSDPGPPLDGTGPSVGSCGSDSQAAAEMRLVQCVCGAELSLPLDVYIFQCAVCKKMMQLPKELTEEERKQLSRRALNRWMVREAVSKELDNWLSGNESFGEDANSIVARFYRLICEFPLFSDKSSGIDKALLDLFLFLPTIEDKLVRMGGQRRTVRTRFVNFIAGPVFYASFGDDVEDSRQIQLKAALSDSERSRGEKKDLFKADLASLLREIEKPDGAATILEAVESSHSIQEIPGAFGRMTRSHLKSAVANLEHSLAKRDGRSKLKSLYHLVPRRALIKMMKLNMGTGLAGAAVNLFMIKPFGSRSLMQRMAGTTLGVTHAEDVATFASKNMTPEMVARCTALLDRYDGDERGDIVTATDDEILNSLGSDALTRRLGCPPVPPHEIDSLRKQCEAWYAKIASSKTNIKRMTSLNSYDESSSDSDADIDADEAGVEVTEKGDIVVRKDAAEKEQTKRRSMFTRFRKHKESAIESSLPHPLLYVRSFCENEQLRRVGETVVSLLGDDAIEKFIRVSLPVIQKHMITSVSSKGSGLIPLMEGLFDAWKQVLLAAKNSRLSTAERRAIYERTVERIQELTFTLVHNLIRSDRSGKWHELVYWLVDVWNMSKMDIDTDSMINSLEPNERQLVESEAEILRKYHEDNSRRAVGSTSLPPPALDASWKLVALLRERISQGLFSGLSTEEKQKEFDSLAPPKLVPVLQPDSMAGLSLSDKRASPRKLLASGTRPKVKRMQSGFDVQHREHQARLFLSHIEVVYSYEDDSTMVKRGYERVPVDFCLDGETQCWLWIRRSLPEHQTTYDGTPLEWMEPIVDIRVVDCEERNYQQTEMQLRANGYFLVAKPLDKRSHFLWYKRDSVMQPIRNLSAVWLEGEHSSFRQQALKASGYELVAPIIRYTIKAFFGMSSRSASIALFLKR